MLRRGAFVGLFCNCLLFIVLNSSAQKRIVDKPFDKSEWITNGKQKPDSPRRAPVFVKDFSIQKPVRKVQLFISALGLCKAELNGKQVSNDLFSPGFTNYNRRIAYRTYDVTGLIKKQNKLAITVGEGWYRGPFRGAQPRDNYGDKAGVIVTLVIQYFDGRIRKIVTDQNWRYTYGPIQYSELYGGELYDANISKNKEEAVQMLNHSKATLYPETKPSVRSHETFPCKVIGTESDRSLILDFGQNLAGWVQLNLKGHKGDSIKIQHAEVLDSEGNIYTGNLREAKAIDKYVLNGIQGIYQPHFTYHGFRYARLSWIRNGKTIELSSEKWSAKAVALYSNLKKTGTFQCSDPIINRLQKNIEWSLNSNFFEIPTDCPQRSEREGWTGDAQIFAPTACYLRDARSFYTSWLKDLALEQGKDGGLPSYVPAVAPYQENQGGCAGWDDAATIVPWAVYEAYDDKTVLQNQYASMKLWVSCIQNSSKDGLWTVGGYGDWYAQGPRTDIGVVDQCYWAHSADIVANAAKVLGNTKDMQYYSNMAKHVREEFLLTYLKADTLKGNTQTAYILALAFDMLPKDKRAIAAKQLVKLIHQNNDHLATGFLGTPRILQVLSDNGYTDVAYTLLNQKTSPSWLYPIAKSATSIWEKWEGIRPDGTLTETSLNHYAYGAVGNWLYEYVAGLRKAAPGYKKILIKPVPGGGLTWAKATYKSTYGLISSSWKMEGKNIRYDIVIPKGTTARIELLNISAKLVGVGHYTFLVPAGT